MQGPFPHQLNPNQCNPIHPRIQQNIQNKRRANVLSIADITAAQGLSSFETGARTRRCVIEFKRTGLRRVETFFGGILTGRLRLPLRSEYENGEFLLTRVESGVVAALYELNAGRNYCGAGSCRRPPRLVGIILPSPRRLLT